MAGKRTKIVYCFQNVDGEMIGGYFKDRQSALVWEKENKSKYKEPIFLMKREILEKRWKEIFQKEKLKDYGFYNFTIEKLLKGQTVSVSYGKVKYDSNTGTLFTYYPDGRIKEEQL